MCFIILLSLGKIVNNFPISDLIKSKHGKSCFSNNMTFDPRLYACIGICEYALVLDPEPCVSHMLDRQAFCKRTGASGLQNHIFCCRKKAATFLYSLRNWQQFYSECYIARKHKAIVDVCVPFVPYPCFFGHRRKIQLVTTSLREKGWFKKVSQKYRQAEEYCYKQPVHIPSINRIMNKSQRTQRSVTRTQEMGLKLQSRPLSLEAHWLPDSGGWKAIVWSYGEWDESGDRVSHCCASYPLPLESEPMETDG